MGGVGLGFLTLGKRGIRYSQYGAGRVASQPFFKKKSPGKK